MKYKPQSKKAALLIVFVAIVLMLAIQFIGFPSSRSAVMIGSVSKESRGSWSMHYYSLDGTVKKTIRPKGDVLHVSVTTESGTIGIQIKEKDGSVIFDEKDLQTSSFDIEVQGKVTVYITADHHQGGFAISS